MPILTVLDHAADRLQTKNFETGESYSKSSRLLGVRRLKFRTLRKLKKHLQLLAAQPTACVIRGTPNTEHPTRRRKTHFNDAPQAWVMLDIDALRLPKHLQASTYSNEHAAYAITQLPIEFQGVSCVWQASASAGRDHKTLKLHLWFMLDRALTAAELRVWLKSCKAIDPSTLRCVQPHYTADPIGASFYSGERLGLLRSALDAVPVPAEIAAPEHPDAAEIPQRQPGTANVSRETIERSLEKAEQRAQLALDECSVAYQTAYEIGTILGPSVALETWNDAEYGHEAWRTVGENVAKRWGCLVAGVPGASHGDELYTRRVFSGIEYGVEQERRRRNLVPDSQLATAKTVCEKLMRRMSANRGSIATLQEVGKQLGRYSGLVGKEALTRQLMDASCLSELQVTEALEAGASDPVPSDEWRNGLLMRGKLLDEITPCDSNLRLIFQQYPFFMRSFRFNARSKKLEASDDCVLGLRGDVNEDELPGKLVDWLRSLGCPNVGINQAYSVFRSIVSDIEHYDPFIEMFPEALLSRKDAEAELAKLEPRLDTWLCDHFGARDKPFTRLAASKTLIAAVARAVEPGCQVDTMLVLQGEQGIGKTQVLRRLAGVIAHGYQELLDMKDKDSLITMNDGLIVEVSELKALRYSHEETSKAFLSRQRDRIRAPYARAAQDFDRRVIFIGTTNDDEFLSDHQNRRYWPVTCTSICKLSKKQADALWREAALRYASGEQWWLESTDEKELQRKHVSKFRYVDMIEEQLAALLRGKRETTMHEVCRALFPDRPIGTHASDRRVIQALRVLGWRVGRRKNNVRIWVATKATSV